ncbi:flavin reductase family protein [Amycolatopsis carbonis]|uniref:Flavin reductase family protein n=1 Tax=Amycolatopsis carbonis TaxID=715471 RepID=A0A9Y2N0R8_9PSEU|nr:flavin reductase family protein [Amycolatopsis sp. 2-15]WIX82242.1 flavin reductase family protein [Amycolatopsis sp. 2-15]
MRKDFDPADVAPFAFYRLLTATVVPRPIAWVSSTSASGVDNLAPHSFFTVASAAPPVLQFTSVGRKDTLRNVEATGQFVVNLAPEHLFEKINDTGTDFPPDHSEFDAAGLTREPSTKVKPPRVAQSPVAFECELHSTVGFGTSTVVFGRVVHVAVAEEMLDGDHPVIGRLRPLARLGGDEWGTVGDVKEISRIRFADWNR